MTKYEQAYNEMMSGFEPTLQVPEVAGKGVAAAVLSGSLLASSFSAPVSAQEITPTAAMTPSEEDFIHTTHEQPSYDVEPGNTTYGLVEKAIGSPQNTEEGVQRIVVLNAELQADSGALIVPGQKLNGLYEVVAGDSVIDAAQLTLPPNTTDAELKMIGEIFALKTQLPRNEAGNPIIHPGDLIYTEAFWAIYEDRAFEPAIADRVVESDAPAAADTLATQEPVTEMPEVEIIEPKALERPIPNRPADQRPESDSARGSAKVESEVDLGRSLVEPKNDSVGFVFKEAASPVNLGEILPNGRYLLPESDRREFSGKAYPIPGLQVGTPVEFRGGSLRLVQVTDSIAEGWYKKTGTRLIVGDLDAPEYHVSHEFGIDVDLYLPADMYTEDEKEQEAWLELLKEAAQYEDVDVVFFSDQAVIDRYNEWVEEVGATMRVAYEPGHFDHLHIRIDEEFKLDIPSDALYQGSPHIVSEPYVPEAEAAHSVESLNDQAYELLSPAYKKAIKNKPTLEEAIRLYNFPETKDFGPQYEDTDTALLAYLAGFRGEDLRIAIALSVTPDEGIPGAESSNSPFVVNTSAEDQPGFPKGTVAVGPMQMLFNPDWASDPAESIRNPHDNLDPLTNYQNALILKERQGWTVGWEAFRHDKHVPNLPKADRQIEWLKSQGLKVN